MKSTYSVSEAQTQLPGLIRKAEGGESIRIRRHNETVAYLVSRERLEAIVETLELLANPAAMRAVLAYRKGRLKLATLPAVDDDR